MNKLSIIRIAAVAGCFLATMTVSAQQKWTLRQCIDHAMANNIEVRQKMLQKSAAEIDLNTAQMSRLPDLNSSINQNFGRSTSRDGLKSFQNSANTNFSVQSNMPLFTGFRITNEIEAKKWALKAASADLDKSREDIALYVASAFLQVVYNQEIYQVAVEQSKLSSEQVKRAEIMVEAGKLPQSEVYDARATHGRDESEVTRTNSALKLSLVDLAQLLELEKVDQFDVDASISADLLVDGVASLADVDQTFKSALEIRPGMKSAQYKLEEGKNNVLIAQSAYYPTLNMGLSYSNGYFYTYQAVNPKFGTQWNENGQSVLGFNLNIPIFNRFENGNRVKLAKLDLESRKLNLETTRKALLKDVQQAYYNAVAAREKYVAAQKSVAASNLAFQFAREKYDAGKSTSFEFNDSNNRRLKSLSDEVQAKFDFIFRCKILDFYNGKSIY